MINQKKSRLSLLSITFSSILLMAFNIIPAKAETAVRTVNLEATANASRSDATGRIKINIQEFSENTPYGEWIQFDLNFRRLTCRGPFSLDTSDEFYVLYINNQRLVSFNTSCQYSIPGPVGGDFRTPIIFAEDSYNQLQGWLDNPFTDPIHAVVKLESHDTVPGAGPVVLEGMLVE